jgi:hypothetical protein
MNERVAVLNGIVASADGDWSTVRSVVDAAFHGEVFALLAEDSHPTVPPHFSKDNKQLAESELPRGRAFGPKGEVRWREVRPERFSITFLAEGEGIAIPGGLTAVPGPWTATPASQKLTGTHSPKMGDWIEVSVPGISGRYGAIATPDWTAIELRGFNFDKAGLHQMTRYSEIVEFRREAE